MEVASKSDRIMVLLLTSLFPEMVPNSKSPILAFPVPL